MRGESAEAELSACLRHDPVLALRVRLLAPDFAAEPELLHAMLMAVPVATQPGYPARWRQSVAVAYLAQALAVRSGAADAEAAWTAGLSHNLAEYLDGGAGPSAQAADWLGALDSDGWLADAVRYHAEPLARGRAAHPLVRIVQLAYQLLTRADAVDSVDVRAALAALQLGAGEAAQLLAESQTQARQQAARFGIVDAPTAASGAGYDRLARLYAGQAAQAALHGYFRRAHGAPDEAYALLQRALRALFGVERAGVFAPAPDGSLRITPLLPAVAGLAALAIPPDDGHSALPRALARHASQQFERGAPDAALADEQIARLLGVTRFLCQPLALHDGRTGVLVAGDPLPDLGVSPLWRGALSECGEALQPAAVVAVALPPAPAETPAPAADDIPRDRVRRAVHEVANPLTIMRNYVNLLSERLGADSTVQRDLGIIGDEIERVARIVRGITVAEEAVTPAPALELVSVNSVVSELVRMALGTLFTPNKINVQIDLNPDVPPVPLHKDLLKQVLFNLAKNAVEAMHAGGHLRFMTRQIIADGQRQIEIEVADTGPGLPPSVASHLFEPVISEKGGDHAGLGLAISRGLVERMNGQLSCTSTPQGTRFVIRVPTLQNGQAPSTNTRYGSM
ncbi:HAMP domain-containing sensor histidine kinase [Thiobacillus sedimenti]|uniref:histidine kinase n=1 Tax=Thiobacillus sedimenti TaxID=3110231 RepID=A0ABZ1CIY9_9PROT|nr:HAMP domain-containing sensor histidine kinase [Thiobacillus sp. SCUT-2]WRS39360.1 HAMP domain-containing sensor histidine kinase [Thiobacillus sp. SCUT-2]